MTKVDSTVISGYLYNKETQALLVEYRNKSVYLYQDIPANVIKKVFDAESIGRAFRKYILAKEPTPVRIK